MKRIFFWIFSLSLLFLMEGCSWEQVINPWIPKEIQVDQVYWDPAHISLRDCPSLDGTYLITKDSYFSWLGSGLPRVVSRRLDSGEFADVELSIRKSESRVEFYETSPEDEGVRFIEFNEYFGCYNGYYVWRHRPSISSGAEIARCDIIGYAENHWRINEAGDLVVTIIRRNRCWSNRLDSVSENDIGPHTVVHPRIR